MKKCVIVIAAMSHALGCLSTPTDPVGTSTSGFVPGDEQIHAYRDSLYQESDVKYSFGFGVNDERIDCIATTTTPDQLPSLPLPAGAPPPNVQSDMAFAGVDARGNPRSCPPGTVAAMRPSVEQIRAAGGLDAYQRSKSIRPQQSAFQHDCYFTTTPQNGWDHAAGVQVPAVNYQGALTYTSVHQPLVQDIYGEHSLSEMWVQTGSCEDWNFPYGDPYTCTTGPSGNAVQSLEVGWMVGNGFTDTQPHLFIFITQDGYHAKNCWAGQGGTCCPSAVPPQTTDCWVPAPGAPYVVNQPLGTYPFPSGSPPAEMAIQVWNGTPYGYPAWYVYINGQVIGWYPDTTFQGQMQTSASYLQVGGEVFDSWPSGGHTTTYMGSGWAAGHGFGWAAYQRNVMYIDTANTYHNASLGFGYTPAGELDNGIAGLCGYDAGLFYRLSLSTPPGASTWGQYFYFGGSPFF